MEPPQSSNSESRKRKIPPAENEEETSLPSTPKSRIKAEPRESERTPGRNGPIKPMDFSVQPDIKPFKGPPGKKVRKTRQEKNEEYKQFSRENEGDIFHEYTHPQYFLAFEGIDKFFNRLYVCFDKGPDGSPTYDKGGFELDYHKVAAWIEPKPYNKGGMVTGMERTVERMEYEESRMAEIFFEKGEAPSSEADHMRAANHWRDRVSKDLNIPWHKVGVEQFEEWDKKGFKKARRGEYQNFSRAEVDRMMRLMSGASLRK